MLEKKFVKTHVDQNIKMSVGSASSASSAGQRSGRRTNLTVADVYDIAADIGMIFFLQNIFFMQFFCKSFCKNMVPPIFLLEIDR